MELGKGYESTSGRNRFLVVLVFEVIAITCVKRCVLTRQNSKSGSAHRQCSAATLVPLVRPASLGRPLQRASEEVPERRCPRRLMAQAQALQRAGSCQISTI